jgi:hypothetical protein
MSIQPRAPKPKGYKEMPYTGPRRKRNPNVKPAGPKSKDKNKMVAPLKPKRSAMGGPTGKPKPSTDGTRILPAGPGTGTIKPPKRMPAIQKPGGIRDKSVAPAKPKKAKPAPKVKIPSMIDGVVKPKPKYTPLPRKITPRRTPRIGGR